MAGTKDFYNKHDRLNRADEGFAPANSARQILEDIKRDQGLTAAEIEQRIKALPITDAYQFEKEVDLGVYEFSRLLDVMGYDLMVMPRRDGKKRSPRSVVKLGESTAYAYRISDTYMGG